MAGRLPLTVLVFGGDELGRMQRIVWGVALGFLAALAAAEALISSPSLGR
ncbi:MAG TPA: hypothetical protein VJ779_20125 [Acetobacteraceae bacterium]|nr:hypothetical protein [Acetobacteraceae bacterium]